MAKYKKWSDDETSFIRDNHQNMCDATLAAKLSEMSSAVITMSMIRRQRRKLNLVKKRGRPSRVNQDTVQLDSGNK